jgi:hypothetical protein
VGGSKREREKGDEGLRSTRRDAEVATFLWLLISSARATGGKVAEQRKKHFIEAEYRAMSHSRCFLMNVMKSTRSVVFRMENCKQRNELRFG